MSPHRMAKGKPARRGGDDERYILTPYAGDSEITVEETGASSSGVGTEALPPEDSATGPAPGRRDLDQDIQHSLRLLEDRDQELSRTDVELYKLKVRFAERGAVVSDLRDRIAALEQENQALAGAQREGAGPGAPDGAGGDEVIRYVDFDEDGASTTEGGNSAVGEAALQVPRAAYEDLERKLESSRAECAALRRENEELRCRAPPAVDFGDILDNYLDAGGDSARRKDAETQLTFLKHELECEQHLKQEAMRSLEVERGKNIEVRKTLLKDYESKCLSLMRHLKSVEDSFADQQRENERLLEESGRLGQLEEALARAAATARGPRQENGGEHEGLTARNLKRLEEVENGTVEPAEAALADLESVLCDQRTRIRKLEHESRQRHRTAVRSQHRLRASLPLVNLAYAYCAAVSKSSGRDLKQKYPHVSEVKPCAKAIMKYMKKSDKFLEPVKDLEASLSTEPLEMETRRLKNSGVLGLAVFSLDEED